MRRLQFAGAFTICWSLLKTVIGIRLLFTAKIRAKRAEIGRALTRFSVQATLQPGEPEGSEILDDWIRTGLTGRISATVGRHACIVLTCPFGPLERIHQDLGEDARREFQKNNHRAGVYRQSKWTFVAQ